MTQALLYAAFAIIVLISVLAMYQVVTMNAKKTQVTRLMSAITTELQSMSLAGNGTFEGVPARLVARGAIPRDSLKSSNGGRNEVITLPFDGNIDMYFEGAGASGTPLTGIISWANPTRSAVALCNYLSAGEVGALISGPLGSDYVITQTVCESGSPAVGFLFRYPNIVSH